MEQAENSHALEQQNERLRQAGALEIISDIESGSKSNRKEYKLLMKDIKAGLVGEVIITRTDRLSRSLTDLRIFADLCMEHDCNLRILDQQIDLSTPHGKFTFNIIGSAAELELDMLKSRVEAGLRHFRAEKRAHGIVPFGYVRRNDKYHPNTEPYYDSGKTVWEVAREIIEVFLEEETVRGTSRILGNKYGARRKEYSPEKDFPREEGLKYWLESPVLRGHVAYYYRSRNKETQVILNQHTRLITEEESLEINRILSQHRGGRKMSERSELAGLIICAKCGTKARAFRYKSKSYGGGKPSKIRKYPKVVWRCKLAYEAVQGCVRQPGIRDEIIQAEVIKALTQKANKIVNAPISDEPIVDTPEIINLKKSINALLSMGQSQAIINARKELESELESLYATAHEKGQYGSILKNDLIELREAAADPDFWIELSQSDRRKLFNRFVHSVVIEDGVVVDVKLHV